MNSQEVGRILSRRQFLKGLGFATAYTIGRTNFLHAQDVGRHHNVVEILPRKREGALIDISADANELIILTGLGLGFSSDDRFIRYCVFSTLTEKCETLAVTRVRPSNWAAWCRSKELLALVERDGIYIYSRTGNKAGRVPISRDLYCFGMLAWSHDGQQIAIVARHKHERSIRALIYVVDVDTGTYRTLINTVRSQGFPALSPDGNKIAFNVMTPSGGQEIYVMNFDGRGEPTLVKGAYGVHSDWSPDGKYLAYEHGHGTKWSPTVFVTTLDGKRWAQITHRNAIRPKWHPTESNILFTSPRPDGKISIFAADYSSSLLVER